MIPAGIPKIMETRRLQKPDIFHVFDCADLARAASLVVGPSRCWKPDANGGFFKRLYLFPAT